MFPTSGFFRSHNCPYYLSGLCERPYCHFRHMKQEERTAPARPVQQTSKCPRPEQQQHQPPPARQSSRSDRQSLSQSESESVGGGDGVDDDYTPTPLSVLRRAKVAQQAEVAPQNPPAPLPAAAAAAPSEISYEPTPLTVTPSPASAVASSTIPRRRPLLLPAPKSSATESTAGRGQVEVDDYDPCEESAVEPTASKRSRPSAPAEASYEPTPIGHSEAGDDVHSQVEEDDAGDDDSDEYCPTAVSAPPPVQAKLQHQTVDNSNGDDSGAGGEIKKVFLDLFGEEPETAAPAPVASSSSSIASNSGAVGASSGKAGAAVRRMTPSEQVARRAQQLAANPSALLSQGKVRAPSATTTALASSSSSSASTPQIIVAVAASPLPGTVANKIPDVVRQRYLDRLAEECRLILAGGGGSGGGGAAASRRAQQLELECYERSANRNVYLNAVILAIKRVRAAGPEGANLQSQRPKQADEAGQLSDKRFYKHLLKYAMTADQLAENRYPPHLPALPYAPPANPLERLCVRCGVAFLLQRPQMSTPPGQCCYHYGRAYSRRVPGSGVQQIYSCCGGDLQAKGCSLGERHVHEYNVYCDTDGYRETLVPDKATVSKKLRRSVYALDCEMIYTDAGKELARVTVIDRSLSVVYDRLVRPSAPIVDCNTRFSGLREDQLASAQHQLADVQDELLKMIYSTSILIGHSLESDLQVLKLRHGTVVDTSIVFPHRQGLPKKRALRNLASEILNKIIQAGGDAGHDSSEDARTCMELMFIKLTEDLKKGKFSSS